MAQFRELGGFSRSSAADQLDKVDAGRQLQRGQRLDGSAEAGPVRAAVGGKSRCWVLYVAHQRRAWTNVAGSLNVAAFSRKSLCSSPKRITPRRTEGHRDEKKALDDGHQGRQSRRALDGFKEPLTRPRRQRPRKLGSQGLRKRPWPTLLRFPAARIRSVKKHPADYAAR